MRGRKPRPAPPHPEPVQLAVLAVPRASRDELAGFVGEELKVRLKAPPVDGKANDRLIRYLAKQLGVRRADIALVRGHSSRHKQVAISGLTRAELHSRLAAE